MDSDSSSSSSSSSSTTSSSSTSSLPSSPSFTSPFKSGVMLYMLYLSQEDLERFKQLLVLEELKAGSTRITWDQVRTARWGEVVHLLTEYFPGHLAWNKAQHIFASMDKTQLCDRTRTELQELLPHLEPTGPPPRRALRTLEEEYPAMVQHYRQQVLDHYSDLVDRLAWPGNQADFFYQDILRHQRLLPCLFLPRRPHGQPPRTVVLRGVAGAGKTTLAHQVMLEWAGRTFYRHKAWCAFYVHCRHAGALAAKALARPEQLLLILDGFEVLALPLAHRRKDLRADWSRKLPVPVLLASLLSGKMLPQASLLLLLRFSSWRVLKPLLSCPSVLTLSGFTAPERTQYLRRYFGDGRAADKAVDFLRGSAIPSSMCQEPAVCWLVCLCLKEPVERGADLFLAFPNAAALFARHLSNALVAAVGGLPGTPLQECLQGVCSLAAEGMWAARWVFGEKELERAQLGPEAVDALLRAHVLQSVVRGEARYTFALLSFQEFFAALWYVLRFPGRFPEFQKLDQAHVRRLLAQPSRRRNDLAHMALFLFGLFNETCARAVGRSFRCEVSLGNKEVLSRTALWQDRLPTKHHGLPLLFYCLHETREEAFLAQVLQPCKQATLMVAKHRDLQVCAFCLRCCQRLREMKLILTLTIHKAIPEGTNWRLCWWEELCMALALQDLEALSLTNSVIELDAMQALSAALESPRCQLHTLRLEGCSITPGSMLEFAEDLSSNLKLKTLVVRRIYLKDEGACSLSKAQRERLALECCDYTLLSYRSLILPLSSNHRLTHLSLAGNTLRHEGAKDLWSALQKAKCPLQRLVLRNCALTACCCWEAACALVQITTLQSLDLSFNNLTDEGLDQFCKTLENRNFGLQVLELERCQLTSDCCQAVASLLRRHPSLRHLDLRKNDIRLRGVELLYQAFDQWKGDTEVVLERKQSCHVNVALRLEGPRVNNKVLRILQDWDARASQRPR
ncbi:PREDICTED: NACHT, LRR and PYD domains-containing protein 8 [Myotis brandtii]|uniref:NACHT, LRR and PYD domains-containing protein 8 n=1 Tax=Myotis brandtii TaxID=109478 RepID=UPI0007042B9D|nr:PREDICTED: NACHT, LRR and PYD domains-containing protein 8 [Myotis brandtii]